MSTVKIHLGRLLPQLIALAAIVVAISIVFPGFLDLEIQNGRLYGSLIDILNRGAPVVLLAIGMTVVIATKGIDLSVGAVMAICGAVAASLVTSGHSLAETLLATLAVGILCGVWNGVLVAILDIQPIIATLVLMVAGRGVAQLITEGAILTFNHPGLVFIGSGSFAGLPMPVVIWLVFGLLIALLVRKTALGMLIEAIGVNRRASTLSGVLTPVLLIAAYVLSGFCAAIAGTIAAADIRGRTPITRDSGWNSTRSSRSWSAALPFSAGASASQHRCLARSSSRRSTRAFSSPASRPSSTSSSRRRSSSSSWCCNRRASGPPSLS